MYCLIVLGNFKSDLMHGGLLLVRWKMVSFNAARPQNFIFKINVILGCCGYIVLAFKKKV